MKRNWSEIGMLRLLIPFILGILCFSYLPSSTYFIVILCGLSILSLITIKLLSTKFIFRFADELFGFLCSLSLFFLAILLSQFQNESFQDDLDKSGQIAQVYLTSDINEKAKTYQSEVRILYLDSSMKEKKTNAIVYFKKDSLSKELNKGDVIQVKNNFSLPQEYFGDSDFNYRKYLALNDIYFTSYQNSSDWRAVGRIDVSLYSRFIKTLRTKFQSLLNQNVRGNSERAIASALLLGNKSLLDKDTKSTYSQTGAMHILAVSGLHVGIIYGFLVLLFGRLKERRYFKWPIVLIEVGIIIIFAAITDFSPSVTRASLMFSLMAIGSTFLRSFNSYNILAISALLLLVYKPVYLFEVGFQLSYAAVISILFFHKYIYKIFLIKNRIIDFFWNISAVSVAAQIGTVPLTLYYFEQFPTFFWVSNLIAIPAASIILWAGLILFLSSGLSALIDIGIVQNWIGLFIEYSIGLLNKCLGYIQSIPYSVISIENFHVINSVTMYLSILALMYFLYTNALKKKALRVVLASILFHFSVLSADQIRFTDESSHHKTMEIKNISENTSI